MVDADTDRVNRKYEASKKAKQALWKAFVAYQVWQEDDGDVQTFADWARETVPDLMPVSGG